MPPTVEGRTTHGHLAMLQRMYSRKAQAGASCGGHEVLRAQEASSNKCLTSSNNKASRNKCLRASHSNEPTEVRLSTRCAGRAAAVQRCHRRPGAASAGSFAAEAKLSKVSALQVFCACSISTASQKSMLHSLKERNSL